jgi:anti-sigma regulatory factor (Ser/Thr protein kinase)
MMVEYGGYLVRLLSDFIALTKISTDSRVRQPEQLDLGAVCEGVRVLLLSFAERKGVSIVIESEHRTYQAQVDRTHIRQILFNLVHNAIKFSPQGGMVCLRLSEAAPRVLISVSDSGCGIPKEELANIFEPFWCTKDRSVVAHAGFGLGLTLCKELTAIEEGELTVESNVGAGSTFQLSFIGQAVEPFMADTGSNSEPLAQIQEPLRGAKILFIEGEEVFGDAFGKVIESLGGVIEATSAIGDAIQNKNLGDYTSVIVDEGAFEKNQNLLSLIRRSPAMERVVFMTSQNKDSLVSPIPEERVLRKPFSLAELIGSLERVS